MTILATLLVFATATITFKAVDSSAQGTEPSIFPKQSNPMESATAEGMPLDQAASLEEDETIVGETGTPLGQDETPFKDEDTLPDQGGPDPNDDAPPFVEDEVFLDDATAIEDPSVTDDANDDASCLTCDDVVDQSTIPAGTIPSEAPPEETNIPGQTSERSTLAPVARTLESVGHGGWTGVIGILGLLCIAGVVANRHYKR